MRQLFSFYAKARRVLLPLALLLLTVGAWQVGQPIFASEAQLKSQIQQKEREVQNLRTLMNQRSSFQTRLNQAEMALGRLKKQLEQGRNQPSFLTYLEESATTAGITITGLGFDPPQAIAVPTAPAGSAKAATGSKEASTPPANSAGLNAAKRYPIGLKATGPYPGMIALMAKIEAVFPLVTVDKVDIVSISPKSDGKEQSLPQGLVSLDLKLSVVAESGTANSWAKELQEMAAETGRQNPFVGR